LLMLTRFRSWTARASGPLGMASASVAEGVWSLGTVAERST
jgi:hypothetical protein